MAATKLLETVVAWDCIVFLELVKLTTSVVLATLLLIVDHQLVLELLPLVATTKLALIFMELAKVVLLTVIACLVYLATTLCVSVFLLVNLALVVDVLLVIIVHFHLTELLFVLLKCQMDKDVQLLLNAILETFVLMENVLPQTV